MTENKRFKNVEEKLDWGTIQYFTYNDEKITDDEIKDLVNQLLEENEELKQAYVKLKHYHSNLHDECIELECDKDRYYKDVLTLEKENEQLKHELLCKQLDKAPTEPINCKCYYKELQE